MPSLAGRRSISIVTLISILGAVLLIYALFDPAVTPWMPRCPVNFLLGLQCPGCGSQRAIHALVHGNFTEAMRHNALLLVMIPIIAVMGLAEFNRKKWPVFYKRVSCPVVIYTILILVVLWTAVRNLFPLS